MRASKKARERAGRTSVPRKLLQACAAVARNHDDEAEAGWIRCCILLDNPTANMLDNATANNDDPSERRLEDLDARIAENTRNGRINWKRVLATLHKSGLPGDQSYWMH